jgi:hypothetical protein
MLRNGKRVQVSRVGDPSDATNPNTPEKGREYRTVLTPPPAYFMYLPDELIHQVLGKLRTPAEMCGIECCTRLRAVCGTEVRIRVPCLLAPMRTIHCVRVCQIEVQG